MEAWQNTLQLVDINVVTRHRRMVQGSFLSVFCIINITTTTTSGIAVVVLACRESQLLIHLQLEYRPELKR